MTERLNDKGVCRAVPGFAGSAKKKVQKVYLRWESMNVCRHKCGIRIQMEAICMKTGKILLQ